MTNGFSTPMPGPLCSSDPRGLSLLYDVSLLIRPDRAREPERSSQSPWARGGPRQLQPLAIHLVGKLGFDHYVSVLVIRMSGFDSHSLVPAVHSADRIRVNRKGQILMYSAFLPEDPL